MQKVTPFLWFDDKAEEAANFYVGIFRNAAITGIDRSGAAAAGTVGRVMSVTFEIDGQPFIALNGGPHFSFTPAVSLFVNCESQEEVDELWEKLSAGGETQRCGWLKDKFGLSWQIVPSVLRPLLRDPDSDRSNRVLQAMLQMIKLDIAALQRASRGE